MAYLHELRRACQYGAGCDKDATVELRNRHNERMAVYCYVHGRRRLTELQADEAAAQRRAS